MTTLEQAARMALDALNLAYDGKCRLDTIPNATEALRQALEQPTIKDNLKVEQKPCDMGQMCIDCADRKLQAMKQPKQEPVAWISKQSLAEIKDFDATVYGRGGFDDAVPLYAEPPQREWVGLTPNERWELWNNSDQNNSFTFAVLVENKLRDKNA